MKDTHKSVILSLQEQMKDVQKKRI